MPADVCEEGCTESYAEQSCRKLMRSMKRRVLLQCVCCPLHVIYQRLQSDFVENLETLVCCDLLQENSAWSVGCRMSNAPEPTEHCVDQASPPLLASVHAA